MKKRVLSLLIIVCMFLAPAAYAGDIWEMAQSDKYGRKAGGMLGRGLLNAATCFVDLIVHVVEGTKEGPPLIGTLTGLGSGIGCTSLRAVSGVLDVGTFWVPSFNGFPVSRSYSDCLLCDDSRPCPDKQVYATSLAQPVYQQPVPSAMPAQTVVVAPQPLSQVAAPAPVDRSKYIKGSESTSSHDPMKYVKK